MSADNSSVEKANEQINGFGVLLRPIQPSELECVRQWRNHPAVAEHMLNREQISAEQQRDWYERISRDTTQRHYMIRFRDQSIGVINVKAQDDQGLEQAKDIEVGMYLAPESRYRGTALAFCPALALNQQAFDIWQCERLHALVLKKNRAAIRFNEQLGYREEVEGADKSDNSSLHLVLDKAHFLLAQERLSPLLRF